MERVMSDTKQDGKFTTLGTAFLQDMVGIGADIIATSAQLPTEQAQQIAYDLAQTMTAHWGGSMLYVPKTNPDKIHKRNLAIWDDFTGNNHHQLAQSYDLSMIAIYKILAEVKSTLPKPQKDLFDNE